MRRPRVTWRRGFFGGLSLVLVIGLVTATAAVAVVRRSYPTVDGRVRAAGIDAPGQIVRDQNGVPHIYGSTLHDVAFLQGYVTASDRLWQLEFMRRIGQARLSEIFGRGTLDADKFVRTLGWYRAASSDVADLRPGTKAVLQAYADGVNAYAQDHAPPVEFVILGISWEPWVPADSVVIGKIMAWDLSGNMTSELLRQSIALRLGDEALRVLFPPGPRTTPPILSGVKQAADPIPRTESAVAGGGPRVTRTDPAAAAATSADPAAAIRIPGAEQLDTILGDEVRGELGSNNWVIAGSRTRSGKPLLANDPHLGVRNPSIWYLDHLSGGGLEVAGFSIPGVPGVVIGHSARIAWGVTNVGGDVEDLYVEQPDPKDPSRYMYRGSSEPASVSIETIKVKGEEPLKLQVARTRHGPVITPVTKGLKQTVSLRWTALEAGHLVDALFALDRASNWTEFRDALRDWDVPGQNFVYADVDGHIGYQTTGRIPDRRSGSTEGDLPQPGWDGAHEWQGFIPFDLLPSSFDPPEGEIVTANQRVLESYAFDISNEFDPGFRAQRIHQLLDGTAKLAPDDLSRIQMDVVDVSADRFLSFLRDMPVTSDRAKRAQSLLRAWDSSMRADLAAPAIYWSWTRHMLDRVFRDKLGDDLYKQFVVMRGRAALYDMVATPDHPWFVVLAEPVHHGRDDLAALALEDALAELEKKLGPDMSRWQWGTLHQVTFDHPLGQVLPSIFNIGPFASSGGYFTVNNGAFDAEKPYRQTTHPSMRMVVDLSDLEATRVVYPTGQSGQPFAPHWGDLTQKYLGGGYVTLRFATAKQGPLEGTLSFDRR